MLLFSMMHCCSGLGKYYDLRSNTYIRVQTSEKHVILENYPIKEHFPEAATQRYSWEKVF